MGVCYAGGFLYLADTYNNKIKRIDPRTGVTVTVAGDGQAGLSDDPPRFDEPAGITPAGALLFVADTNNHAIRVLQLQPTVKVTTLILKGLEPPDRSMKKATSPGDQVALQREPIVKLRHTSTLRLQIAFEFPAGLGLNPNVPTDIVIQPIRDQEGKPQGQEKLFRVSPGEGPLEVLLTDVGGDVTALRVVCTYFWCEKSGRGLCRIGTVGWLVPIQWTDDGNDTIVIKHRVSGGPSQEG